MRLLTLYSGSGGNSTYIELGDAKILIDAGKSARRLCSALCDVGVCIDEIDAIFITHEHSDHVSALETLTKKHKIPIHITKESAVRFSSERFDALRECIVAHETVFEEEIKGVNIRSFRTPHDSRMSVCYRIEFSDGENKRAIGFATDVGYVTKTICAALLGCEAVVLESNHDPIMLMEGPYPYDLKLRIRSNRGHLSNPDSAAFAATLAQSGTRAFLLAHLSEENNEPHIALDEVECAISDSRVTVAVASPDMPTELCFSEDIDA